MIKTTIDFKTLDEFNSERIKILIEKHPKYKEAWKTMNYLDLKTEFIQRFNTLGLTSAKTPRKLLHIANYCYFLYTRLKEEGI